MEQTLGKRIMTFRKNLGLTQDALAEQLGVTAQAVSKWENDQSCPDINMLPKLAEIFGTTTDELLGIAPRIVHQGEVIDSQDEDDEDEDEEEDSTWEFRWESGRKGSIRAAVLVLLVGGLLLASKLLDWDVTFWGILWPSVMLIFGVFGLCPKFSFFNVGCALFGCYFLVSNLGLLTISIGSEVFFPVLILLFGLSLLADALRKPKKPLVHFGLKRKGKSKSEFSANGETFQCSQSFGENRRYIAFPKLSGGDISCNFGELTADLSGCQTISDPCRIEISCSFGETVLLVPRRFRVENNVSTVFGECAVSGTPDPVTLGAIVVSGSVNFGEIQIRYI